jgi:very-short-patch-repair endonuclease
MDLWAVAADEHRLLTTADLHSAGLSVREITALTKQGRLTSLARSWYWMGTPDNAEHRHVLTTRAMLRAHEGRAVAAHHSALLLLGLPIYRADLSRVRLARRSSGSPRTRSAQSLGRAVPDQALLDETVTPALAVLQHGISSGPLSALVAADAALHRRLATLEELDQALSWVHQHPKSAPLKGFLALADGRRESPGETRLAHALHLMKVQATPQYEIKAEGFSAVVDFRLDVEKVVIEFDGQVKYARSGDETDPYGRRLTPQQVVWLEKQREDRIRELGYEVVRVMWSELDDLVALAQRIAAAVRRARARRLGRLSA